jgi:hypothetical protein
MLMRTRLSWVVGRTVITFLAMAWSAGLFADPSGPVPAAKLEHSTTVRVTDSSGRPIDGAIITSTDFTEKWLSPVKTDENGVAKLDWPHYSPGFSASVLVDHPDFILQRGNIPIGAELHPIWLRKGSAAQFMARLPDETGPAHELRLDAGETLGVRWTQEDGLITVSRLDLEPNGPPYYARLVQVADRGSSYFSEILNLRDIAAQMPPPTIPLHRGLELRGRLSADVPRPIRSGRVFVAARQVTGDGTLPVWRRTALINSDGDFLVDSIPPGTYVDLLAVCDGWSSVCPTEEEVLRVAALAEDARGFRLAAPTFRRCTIPRDPAEPIVVPMEAAVDACVKVVDAAGTAVAGAQVEVKWFQYLPGGDYVVLGSTTDSNTRLLAEASPGIPQPLGNWKFEPKFEKSFEGPTDSAGLVDLKSIPRGRSNFGQSKGLPAIGLRILVSHPDWKPQERMMQDSRFSPEFVIRMEKKPEQVAR